MDVGSDEFRRTACSLIHESSDSQPELASSLKRLVQRQFFVGEEVVLTAADGKPVGTVIETLRGGSPSNKENETKYNVQVGEEIVREVPHSKLKRKEKLEQSDLFSFITSVARKPTANGPWLLRDEFIKSYGGNQKMHPIFAMKTAASASSSSPASNGGLNTPPPKKARLSAKEDEPPLITLDDSDDDEPVVVAGPSTNGTAGGKKKKATPKTPKLPRPKKTSSTKKSPVKKTIKKSPTAAKSKAGTSKASTSKAGTSKAAEKKPLAPKAKKAAEKNGTAGTSKSTSKKETAPKKEAAPKKKTAKQLNISAFLTPNTSGSQKDSPVLSFEQRMEKKALNTSKQIVKKIVNMDTADLTKVLEAAARSLPAKFTTGIANEFVRYLIEKTRVKQEAKSLDVAERAEYRKKHVYAFEARNEFYFMQHRLMSGKFEDSWIEATELPELPLAVPLDEQELFVKCTRVAIFVQSYREILGIRKAVGILELHAALKAEEKEDAFAKITAPLLAGITEFIRRNQKSIPHFTRGGFLASSIRFVSADIAQEVARKVLFPAYRPFADESRSRSASTSRMTTPMDKEKENGDLLGTADDEDDDCMIIEPAEHRNGAPSSSINGMERAPNDDEPMETSSNGDSHSETPLPQPNGREKTKEAAGKKKKAAEEEDDGEDEDSEGQVDEQTKEDDELCEKFTQVEMFELTPLEQGRIFELLLERCEVSGPIRDQMRSLDGDLKELNKKIAKIQEKIDKKNDEIEKLPPLIPEELYGEFSRAQTIGAMKSNRRRQEIGAEIEEFENKIGELQEQAMDLRAFTRYRATPLGVDRFHRRWWFFPPSAGLFVQQGAWTTAPPDAEAPLMIPPRKKFHTYDVSTDTLLEHMRVLLNGTYPAPTAPVRWFHIDSVELLDRAIGALAEKGVRESDLKAKVNDVREAVVALLEAAADRR